jgi:hypothetical protein
VTFAGLESIVKLIDTTTRRRHAMEASWPLTRAYARLVIANGFARLGHPVRARQLATLGEGALAPFASMRPPDVHGCLLQAFAARLDDALAFRPRTIRLPDAVTKAIASLDYERHALDDLLVVSPTIGFAPPPGSDGMFSGFTDDVAIPQLAELVDEALRCPPQIQAYACMVVARFGFGELVQLLIDRLAPVFATASATLLVQLVPPIARATQWLGMNRELASMLHRSRARDVSEPSRFVIAGCLLGAGDPYAARTFTTAITAARTVEAFRAIAVGASYASAEAGAAVLSELMEHFPDVTDGSRRAYYCHSVVHFVETLVLANVDLELAHVNVLDPATRPLLGSGFVF